MSATASSSDPQVRDEPDDQRYSLYLDGVRVSSAVYRTEVDDEGRPVVLAVLHTETDAAHRGRGLAGLLIRGLLDDVRRRGLTIRPLCPYTGHFVENHPEYADLVVDGGSDG